MTMLKWTLDSMVNIVIDANNFCKFVKHVCNTKLPLQKVVHDRLMDALLSMRGSRGGKGDPDPHSEKSQKITKQQSQHSILGHQQLASETPLKWRFAGEPMMARDSDIWFFPPSPKRKNKKKKKKKKKNVVKQSWKLSWIPPPPVP